MKKRPRRPGPRLIRITLVLIRAGRDLIVQAKVSGFLGLRSRRRSTTSAACSRPACSRQAPLYYGSAELAERLDSGLRRNDDGALRNDAEDYQNVSTPSVVIPAKAGIQEGRPGG